MSVVGGPGWDGRWGVARKAPLVKQMSRLSLPLPERHEGTWALRLPEAFRHRSQSPKKANGLKAGQGQGCFRRASCWVSSVPPVQGPASWVTAWHSGPPCCTPAFSPYSFSLSLLLSPFLCLSSSSSLLKHGLESAWDTQGCGCVDGCKHCRPPGGWGLLLGHAATA